MRKVFVPAVLAVTVYREGVYRAYNVYRGGCTGALSGQYSSPRGPANKLMYRGCTGVSNPVARARLKRAQNEAQ